MATVDTPTQTGQGARLSQPVLYFCDNACGIDAFGKQQRRKSATEGANDGTRVGKILPTHAHTHPLTEYR